LTGKPLAGRAVWFVAGSQHLYGDEAIAQVDENAAHVASALDAEGSIPVSVVHKPAVTTPEAIRALCLAANSDGACVGVIVWMHTFSPARMWIAGLAALEKPVLHLHTQFNRELPWAEIDMDFMNLNQAAHGDREHGYLQTRMGLARRTVAGHWADPKVAERIGAWSRAACGWDEARLLKVARFGDNMRQVAVTEGDKVEAQIRLGVSVNGYGVGELVDAVSDASQDSVDALLAAYESEYDVAPVLLAGGARRSSLVDAARIEAGLRAVLERGGFGAFTDTFEDLHGLAQLPGIGAQRLMADGFGFGAEGDWKAAAMVRILKVMATGLPGGTSFMEDYTYDFSDDGPLVLGAHMLEICPSIAAGKPTCEIHPLSIGGREDPVRLVFTTAPGPAVVVSLVDLGDRFRLVANEIEIIRPPRPLPKLPVARAVWRPRPDLATAATAWLEAGGSHHTVLTTALETVHLEDLAGMAGIELLVIDEHTRNRDFRNELRWNQAYYRLAQGL
jgi:L-arabinose isomerase